jgi:hypothetical protein
VLCWCQLTLAGKYPLLKKELDQFLGVPEKVDLPKKYPKTPKPLAGAKGKIDKPLGLEDSTGEVRSAHHRLFGEKRTRR